MLISIDFDKTYTRDPVFWREFIANALKAGHFVICVTNRAFASPETEKLAEIIQVFYAGAIYKRVYAQSLGYSVDVWIDDMPETIAKSVELP